jgi:prolyl oligopeptidase
VQDWFYFEYAKPQDEHSRLYRTKSDDLSFLQAGKIDEHAEIFFDPDRDLADSTIMSVETAAGSWSDDGNYWAYPLKKGGSDWETIKVRNATSNTDLADELSWVKFSDAMWTNDSRGFFYTKYDAPVAETLDTAGTGTEKLSAPKLMYHRLGTD